MQDDRCKGIRPNERPDHGIHVASGCRNAATLSSTQERVFPDDPQEGQCGGGRLIFLPQLPSLIVLTLSGTAACATHRILGRSIRLIRPYALFPLKRKSTQARRATSYYHFYCRLLSHLSYPYKGRNIPSSHEQEASKSTFNLWPLIF